MRIPDSPQDNIFLFNELSSGSSSRSSYGGDVDENIGCGCILIIALLSVVSAFCIRCAKSDEMGGNNKRQYNLEIVDPKSEEHRLWFGE